MRHQTLEIDIFKNKLKSPRYLSVDNGHRRILS